MIPLDIHRKSKNDFFTSFVLGSSLTLEKDNIFEMTLLDSVVFCVWPEFLDQLKLFYQVPIINLLVRNILKFNCVYPSETNSLKVKAGLWKIALISSFSVCLK